jgi:aminoglycoside 6'-N-acetyltransferase I
MEIRAIEPRHALVWAAMRSRLWPGADPGDLEREALAFFSGTPPPVMTIAFLAQGDRAEPIGFVEASLRAFADGCDSMPVPHLEGWYVEPSARGRGAGRALLAAVEDWARARGFTEIASDTETHNAASATAHEACGYVEVERLIKFRKAL